jgi:hypothetical protein
VVEGRYGFLKFFLDSKFEKLFELICLGLKKDGTAATLY